jgi:hypothetical protein
MGFGHPVTGWVLPQTYYRKAVSALPPSLRYFVVSDMPQRATAFLDWLPNKVVLSGNPPAVDMFLLTKARYVIASNSTFAWWGAWLNRLPDAVVCAPKYFLGWWRKVWCPNNIAVPTWQYIDCQ